MYNALTEFKLNNRKFQGLGKKMKIPELSIERNLTDISNRATIFHRIDIEYIAVLRAYNKKNIYQTLICGLKDNLEQAAKSFIWEDQIYSQLDQVTSSLALQTTRLLRKTQTKIASRRYAGARREHPSERLANHAILEVIEGDTNISNQAAKHAIELITQSLDECSDNYKAHFELAWLQLFFLKNYKQAESHFLISVKQARCKNPLFSLFALRHLAKLRYEKGDYIGAESAMSEVLNKTMHPDPEYQYEYARYLAMAGELKLSAMYLEQAIEKLPIYYMQATVEPDFKGKGIISQLLTTYKEQSLLYIREKSEEAWRQSELANLDLPKEISTQRVFKETCEKHEAEIKKHSLVIVKKSREQINEQLLKRSKEALLTELIDKENQYMKKIVHKRTHWKLINKSGGMLIHAATVLLLATLFVLAAKIMLISVGLGTVFYFEEVTGQAFLAVMVLGIAGFYLLRSQPFGIKKLFQKSLLFRDAMTVVHKM